MIIKTLFKINSFIARGILEPLKGARPLQQYGRLPDKYTIHRDVIVGADAPLSLEHRNELFSLSPPINIDYYATHSGDYLRDRTYILRINDLICRREECEVLTANERCNAHKNPLNDCPGRNQACIVTFGSVSSYPPALFKIHPQKLIRILQCIEEQRRSRERKR